MRCKVALEFVLVPLRDRPVKLPPPGEGNGIVCGVANHRVAERIERVVRARAPQQIELLKPLEMAGKAGARVLARIEARQQLKTETLPDDARDLYGQLFSGRDSVETAGDHAFDGGWESHAGQRRIERGAGDGLRNPALAVGDRDQSAIPERIRELLGEQRIAGGTRLDDALHLWRKPAYAEAPANHLQCVLRIQGIEHHAARYRERDHFSELGRRGLGLGTARQDEHDLWDLLKHKQRETQGRRVKPMRVFKDDDDRRTHGCVLQDSQQQLLRILSARVALERGGSGGFRKIQRQQDVEQRSQRDEIFIAIECGQDPVALLSNWSAGKSQNLPENGTPYVVRRRLLDRIGSGGPAGNRVSIAAELLHLPRKIAQQARLSGPRFPFKKDASTLTVAREP